MLARLARSLPRALAAAAAVLVLCDCSTIRHVFHTGDNTTKQAEQLQILQLRNQRFADEYVGSIIPPIRQFQASTENAVDRLEAQNWMLSQATAAYTIASGPSPYVNVVDMVVLATLSRMVIDDAWVGERFGERTAPLRDAYHRLEPSRWRMPRAYCHRTKSQRCNASIVEWRAQNPHVTAISYVHFRDIAGSMQRPAAVAAILSPAFSPCLALIHSAAWTPRCARLHSRESSRSARFIMRSVCRTCSTCRWSG